MKPETKLRLEHGLAWMSNRPAWFWLGLAIALMISLYSFVILRSQSTLINGQRVFWLQDDMMITMRYAQNLAHGDGLVWNPGGERVEGYSNLAWLMVMALVHLLPLPTTLTSLVMLGINVGLAAVVLALASRLMRTLAPQTSLALPAMLLALIVCYDLARWTVIGLETVLLTAVFLWLILRVLSEAQRDAPTAVTYLAAGALGLVRADGILYAGLVWLLGLILHKRRRRVLMLGPLALILPITQVLFRLSYYGYPLPNTYYLKLAGWTWMDRLWGGVHYVWTFLRAYGVLWLIAAIGIWRSQDRRVRALWVLALPIFPYSVYVGGDVFGGSRFFAPWVPILLVLAFLTPLWLGREKQPWRYAASLVGLVVLAFLLSRDSFGRGMTPEGEYARVGLALRDMTSPSTRVANFAAGIVPYLSERPSIDVLGKNDAYVGHQPTHPGNQVPGHNKYDFEYSLARLRPDLVVIVAAFPTQIRDPRELERLSHGAGSFAAQLYLDPTFQRDYAASAIVIGRVPIFIRSDSPERKRLMVGECQPVIQSTLNDLGMQRVCWPDWRPPSSQ